MKFNSFIPSFLVTAALAIYRFIQRHFFYIGMTILVSLVIFFGYWPRPSFSLPTTSLQHASDWQSAWQQLDERKDVSNRLWEIQGNITIKEGFRTTTSSYWQVEEGYELTWDNTLWDTELQDMGQVTKLGAGRLTIQSTGALRNELDLLEGSLYLGRADIFTPYGARLITHPGTRLEYGPGVQMQGTMHLVPHPNYCGAIDCPVLKDTGPYANGLQWVVDAGSAEQFGSIYSEADIPIYKLGAPLCHTSCPLIVF